MFTKPNLRLATINVPGYCETVIINEKSKLKGLRIFTNIVELFERAGFNVSLVSVDEQTTGIADENGTYNGLYGAVQSGVSLKLEKYVQTIQSFLKKADTSFLAVPVRIAKSIGQPTPIITDFGNVILTKRAPIQVFEGTLYDCLTTLGPLNNLLLGVILATFLIFLSLLGSKHASWNFFAQIMTQNFVHFLPMSLQLTFMVALFAVEALFGAAYSTDAAIAVPPKLINSLGELAKSKLLPIWIEGDPVYLEFVQKLTKAHADVFNMGPKNRTKSMSLFQFQEDYSERFETNSLVHFEHFTPSFTKYACKYKSSQVCSGSFRMFISKPFSRTAWTYVYSKNTLDSTADALKKYANQFLQQSLFGDTFKTASDEYFAPSPQCENEMYKGVEAVAVTDEVRTKLVPWRETIGALIAATVAFSVEILFTIL